VNRVENEDLYVAIRDALTLRSASSRSTPQARGDVKTTPKAPTGRVAKIFPSTDTGSS